MFITKCTTENINKDVYWECNTQKLGLWILLSSVTEWVWFEQIRVAAQETNLLTTITTFTFLMVHGNVLYSFYFILYYMCLQMLRSHCRLDHKDTYRDPVSEEESLKRYTCYRYDRWTISSQSGAAISFLGWTNFLFLQKCVALLAQKCLFKVTCHFKMIFDQSAAIPASILSLVIGSQRLFIYRLWGTFTALSPFLFTILKKFLSTFYWTADRKETDDEGSMWLRGLWVPECPTCTHIWVLNWKRK